MTATLPHPQRLRADLILLGTALIWGSAFVVQRLAAAHFGFFAFNGLRFLLGALTVLLFLRGGLRRFTRNELLGGALAGLFVFGGASFQQAGLSYTTAGKAGFISGLYVVLVPTLLAIFWRQATSRTVWVAVLIAATGMWLLSAEGRLTLSYGDTLELIGALIWALQVITIGKFAARVDPYRFAFVEFLTCGLLSLFLGLVFEPAPFEGLYTAWWVILYTGVLSVGLAYTGQVVAQRIAPPSDSALIMSTEAAFAALFGWWFLAELLTPLQLLGCALMLAGMLLAQRATHRRPRM